MEEEVALEDGKAEGDHKEAETPMSHEENMERLKALAEDGVGSAEKDYLLIRIQGCLIIRKWQLP